MTESVHRMLSALQRKSDLLVSLPKILNFLHFKEFIIIIALAVLLLFFSFTLQTTLEVKFIFPYVFSYHHLIIYLVLKDVIQHDHYLQTKSWRVPFNLSLS